MLFLFTYENVGKSLMKHIHTIQKDYKKNLLFQDSMHTAELF